VTSVVRVRPPRDLTAELIITYTGHRCLVDTVPASQAMTSSCSVQSHVVSERPEVDISQRVKSTRTTTSGPKTTAVDMATCVASERIVDIVGSCVAAQQAIVCDDRDELDATLIITSLPIGVRNIAISVSVCLSVRTYVSLYVCI